MADRLPGAVKRFSDWYFERALPVWRGRMPDPAGGGFHEALDKTLAGVSSQGKRIMVQARLCFVFAHGYCLRGDAADLTAAAAGFDFLVSRGRHPEGGWHHKLRPDGTPLDDTRDLYDHAFILFATAWLDRAGIEGAAETAAATQAFLDAEMHHPEGGYVENIGRAPGPRRQNPHMHLLEAYLAWFEATGNAVWRNRAADIVAVFDRAFVVEGSLREYFTDDWRPAPGDTGRRAEPGHHFEWVWLLHRYAALVGDANDSARQLYAFACRHGIDDVSGGIVDEVTAVGLVLSAKRRLWPQTEAIKAHHACWRAGDPEAEHRLEAALDALWHRHLDGEPDGGWREHLSPDGALLRDDKPGSSLYHLAMAVHEISGDGDA